MGAVCQSVSGWLCFFTYFNWRHVRGRVCVDGSIPGVYRRGVWLHRWCNRAAARGPGHGRRHRGRLVDGDGRGGEVRPTNKPTQPPGHGLMAAQLASTFLKTVAILAFPPPQLARSLTFSSKPLRQAPPHPFCSPPPSPSYPLRPRISSRAHSITLIPFLHPSPARATARWPEYIPTLSPHARAA